MRILTSSSVKEAALLLRRGELVAFPTETVYGLGAPIFNPLAIQKIFQVKGRPSDNPLIAHIGALSQVEEIAIDIPPEFYQLSEIFFPGPLTLILRRKEAVPALVSAGLDTIAFRMPNHPLALSLIQEVGEPLVAPSANLSGKPSATRAEHVLEDFKGKISAVLDGGATTFGIESTVISLYDPSRPLLLRPGQIIREELERVLGRPVAICSKKGEERVISPGMRYRHYAPNAFLKLFTRWEELEEYAENRPQIKRLLLVSSPIPRNCQRWEHLPLSAKELYSAFRYADREGYEEILLLCNEEILSNVALMNRLQRAMEI